VGATLLSYPRAWRGGLGTYMRNILQALPAAARARGHDLEVFWGSEGPRIAAELGVLHDGRVHHAFGSVPLRRRAARLPYEHFAIPALGRRERRDLFHFLDHIISVIPPAPKSIVTLHELATFRFGDTFGKFRGRYKLAMTRMSVRRATLVIANSKATRDDLVTHLGVPATKIRVVYYGLNPIFAPVRERAVLDAARARHGLPERFLIFVGTIEPRKNLDRVIQAYALARRLYGIDIPLVLAGQLGWLYERTIQLPRVLGIEEHVRFVPYIPQADLPAVYSQSDGLVFPTLYEGFGLPIIEALGCGAPVLTSRTSAMPEVAGGLAVLVDQFDVESIAQGLHGLLADRDYRVRTAEFGPSWASEFTWERAARETVAVYEEALRC
jgi:glycosyltransferase involved in cell wall biosynthesis